MNQLSESDHLKGKTGISFWIVAHGSNNLNCTVLLEFKSLFTLRNQTGSLLYCKVSYPEENDQKIISLPPDPVCYVELDVDHRLCPQLYFAFSARADGMTKEKEDDYVLNWSPAFALDMDLVNQTTDIRGTMRHLVVMKQPTGGEQGRKKSQFW